MFPFSTFALPNLDFRPAILPRAIRSPDVVVSPGYGNRRDRPVQAHTGAVRRRRLTTMFSSKLAKYG